MNLVSRKPQAPFMETGPNEARLKARLERVAEHVRQENLHNLDGILATFGPEARYDDEPWDDHRVGRDGVESYYRELLAAAPDLKIEVKKRHAAEETVILEVIISGTQTGAWRGLPATGRAFSFPLCGIYTFDAGDRILGEKIYYDRAAALKQLGIFREPASVMGQIATALNHPWVIMRAFVRRWLGR